MAHTSFPGTDQIYHGILGSEEWSLCLGAGICHGILPEWKQLTLEVLNRCSGRVLAAMPFRNSV